MIKDLSYCSDKVVAYITATLSALAYVLVLKIDTIVAWCPAIGEWGPIVLGAIGIFLTVLGYLPGAVRLCREMVYKLRRS